MSGKGIAILIPIPAKREIKYSSLLGSSKVSFHHSFMLMIGKMSRIDAVNQSVIYTFYHFIKNND
jgi:hypothetical protein